MAITVTCDLCQQRMSDEPIKVEVRDGEHPHNGATMYKTLDCCAQCIRSIPNLKSPIELDELMRDR